ncbi:MAG: hypothetical protein NTZ95_00195 [Candidatus Omnitrophica bacterium]|nr:hypothetical protein [Candidatus Omnitrophota bacterium]
MKKHKILITAIGISLGWHLFCISAIKVVASPLPSKIIKFGKVSFLGPMASRSGMELKLSPRQRSFLERRYLSRLDSVARGRIISADFGYADYEPELQTESGITGFIENAVAGSKVEPDNVM